MHKYADAEDNWKAYMDVELRVDGIDHKFSAYVRKDPDSSYAFVYIDCDGREATFEKWSYADD